MVSAHPQASRSAGGRSRGAASPIGIRDGRIAGGFVRISTHQLVMAWWLHLEGHITRRQLRVWFAAFEMAERRRHSKPDGKGPERPLYRLSEIQRLVGGAGSKSAAADLRGDVRRLARLGLVTIRAHSIQFAVSVDEITIDDTSRFRAMFERMPNRRRTVPVPRRTLRAMAAGFSRAVTGVMIALLIRSVFWHREQGDYRCDGRTKLSWIAGTFGISRRAVTDARLKLIELGWLEPVEAAQWEMNRWGVRDRVRTDWHPNTGEACKNSDTSESASPPAEIAGHSASPCLNQSASLTRKNTNTRRPGAVAPDPAGVFVKSEKGSRGRRSPKGQGGAPSLRDIQPHHLRGTEDLLELHRQAVEAGLVSGSEAGRLDFLALAERARARGNNPGGLLRWLLTHRKFEFITQADDDAAAERLRAWRNGPTQRRADPDEEDLVMTPARPARELSEEEKIVQICLRVAEQKRMRDPFYIVREWKGWTREKWIAAKETYERGRIEALTGPERTRMPSAG